MSLWQNHKSRADWATHPLTICPLRSGKSFISGEHSPQTWEVMLLSSSFSSVDKWSSPRPPNKWAPIVLTLLVLWEQWKKQLRRKWELAFSSVGPVTSRVSLTVWLVQGGHFPPSWGCKGGLSFDCACCLYPESLLVAEDVLPRRAWLQGLGCSSGTAWRAHVG